jgi:hypothetical protein
VYKGFEKNEDFLNHLKTLLEWKVIKRDSVHPILLESDVKANLDADSAILNKLGILTLETKDLNKELALGIQ